MATKAVRRKVKQKIAPEEVMAFGESFGLAVPTKYSEQTHAAFDSIMAADCAIMPMITGMSWRTLWLCRVLALGLLVLRDPNSDLSLRYRLELEAAAGFALIILGLQGSVSPWLFERLYLMLGGGMMIANSLMTQVEA